MYIITGGAGFIGSNIAAKMEAREMGPIVVVDRLRQNEKWRNIAKRELYDIIDPEYVFRFLSEYKSKIDGIIHMGAISSTTEVDVDLIFRTNYQFSVSLWDWCTENQKIFIYASSAATYGDGKLGFEDDCSIDFLRQLRPLNAYGWTKHQFDLRVARIVKNNGPTPPKWVGLKFFNVYGPNEYHKNKMASVIFNAYPVAEKGEPFKLFKSHNEGYHDGGQLRDFVWVNDCVEMVLWCIENKVNSGIFNCGSGSARSFNDLICAIYRTLGKEPKIEFVETPKSIRENYQYYTKANLDRLRESGFLFPATSLEEGIRQYLELFLTQDDRFR